MPQHLIVREYTPETRAHVIFLQETSTLDFTAANRVYQELLTAIQACEAPFPIVIQHNNAIDFTYFASFIQALIEHRIVSMVTFNHASSMSENTAHNQLLFDYYLFSCRQQTLDITTAYPLTHHATSAAESEKIRRSKQMLNRGLRLRAQTEHQYQHQHHQEHTVQQENQHEQQQTQQHAQTRQNQIQQQQQRMQDMVREQSLVPEEDLRTLIHAGNLDAIVADSGLSLEELKAFWSGLVGAHAAKVDSPYNRITHIPKNTLLFLLKHPAEWRDGIVFHDLPNGFGFVVHDAELDEHPVQQSIFYYDKRLLKHADAREDSPLSAACVEEPPFQIQGTVGQLYPFATATPFDNDAYQAFITAYQSCFDDLFDASKRAILSQKKASFIRLMHRQQATFNPELLAIFPDLSEHELAGLSCIFIDKGAESVLLFLENLQRLKQVHQYELFKLLFLDRSPDWRNLVSTKTTRAGELNALECIDYLCSMPPEQRSWWSYMADHHAKANPEALSMTSLVNAQHYFFTKIAEIDSELHLPTQCPIENLRNMKTVYARLLYLLKKAIDPMEQAKHLAKLDFGMQGFMCGASYLGNYVFVSEEMALNAESTEFDWEKCRKYAPKSPSTKLLERMFLRVDVYQGNNPAFAPSPELHFLTTPFRATAHFHESQEPFVMQCLYRDAEGRVAHRIVRAPEYIERYVPPETINIPRTEEFYMGQLSSEFIFHGEYTDVFLDQVDAAFEGYSIRLIHNNRVPQKEEIKPHRAYIYSSGTPAKIMCALLKNELLHRFTIPTQDFSKLSPYGVFSLSSKASTPGSYRAKLKRPYVSIHYDEGIYQAIISYLTTQVIPPRLSRASITSFTDDDHKLFASISPERGARIHIANYIADYLRICYLYANRLLEESPGRPVKWITDLRIRDPKLQDESIMTASKTLSYGTDLESLVKLAKKLCYFSNINKYFYRLVGQNPFSLPFERYQSLTTQLSQTTLHARKTTNAVLQNQLLPLLAVCTIGERALEQDRDVLSDLASLTNLLQQQPLAMELVEDFNDKHINSTPRPTLHEITAIWQVSTDQASINRIMACVILHGPSVYQALVYCSQRKFGPNSAQLPFLLDSLEALNPLLEANKKSAYILLASLTRTEDWARLPELIECLSMLECCELAKLLETVSITDSSAFVSIAEIQSLLAALSLIPATEPSRYTAVFGLVTQHLPTIKFRDTSLAQSIAGLIHNLAPFIIEMDTLLSALPNPADITQFISEQAGLDHHATLVQTCVSGFLTRLTTELTTLKDLMSQVTTEGNTALMPAILAKIQAILNVLENPLQDLTGPTGFLLRGMINPLLSLIKTQIITMLSKHILAMLRLDITNAVAQLGIQDSILDALTEKDLKLSVRFSDFLVSQMPELSGAHLAFEINETYKKHEEMMQLLRVLKQMGTQTTRSRRDQLIALLYRRHYFKSSESPLSITELTALIRLIAGKSNVHSVECFNMVFDALEQGIAALDINTTLTTLTEHSEGLSNAEFQTLFKLGLHHRAIPMGTFLGLKRVFDTSPRTRSAFTRVLTAIEDYPDTAEWSILLPGLAHVLHNKESFSEKLADYLHRALEADKALGVKAINEWLSWFSDPQFYAQRDDIITILQASVWSRADENVSLDAQKKLIETLLAQPDVLTKLADLYTQRPNPRFKALQSAVAAPSFDVDAFIHAYELDPFGHRALIQSQWSTAGIDTLVAEISDLQTGMPMDASKQRALASDLAYIIGIGSHYALPICGALKPIAAFTRRELKIHLDELRAKRPIDHTSQLQGLAVMCEVMFRTTGKYPYHSQIVSVLATLHFEGSLLEQIPTGQGKSLSIALMAAMMHVFSEPTLSITVCSRNAFLTGRDYNEARDFYDYLGIPSAWIKASTKENHYARPGIVYATTSDASLYRSKLCIVDRVSWPSPDEQVVICDEVDAEWFDNQNAFNFSHSQEDPFINPLEWLYPLANEYIDCPEFRDERTLEDEDVDLFRRFIKTKAVDKYRRCIEKLSDLKLSQLLDAACIAQPLQEKIDFLVRRVEREVHGKTQTISEAHVIVHHVEDTEATLSHGVQQCLHARLNKLHHDKIVRDEMPAFSCDNQIECVDTQNSHGFFKHFGRLIGCTGTAGTPEELKDVQHRFNIRSLLNIPPRKRSALQNLATVFTDPKASFFFSCSTQMAAIMRSLRQARGQPVMIACENIEKAQVMYAALSSEFAGHVHMIHAENADNQDIFAEKVRLASRPGQITIVTPLAGRGVDIKTKIASSQHPSEQQAETLLVIETHLDRYRNRRQLQGRSARDGRKGATLGIFDVSDIASTHGVQLSQLNRQQKLAQLEVIMHKLDHEACVEREITIAAQQLIQAYESIFDHWLSEAHDSAVQERILSTKAQWIQLSQQAWQALLAESDPEGQYPNPYIRYNDQGELDVKVLHNLVLRFADQIRTTTFPRCKASLAVDDLSAEPVIADPVFMAPLSTETKPTKTTTIPSLSVDASQAYLEKHATVTAGTAHASYVTDLRIHHRYTTRLNYWLKYSSLPEPVKGQLKQQTKTNLDNLADHGRPNDFVVQGRQLQALLEHTQARLNSPWYRLRHPFAQKKWAAIEAFMTTRCPDIMHGLETSPSQATLDAFKAECQTLFAMDTTWGGKGKTTTSIRDFNQLSTLVHRVFFDPKPSLTTPYLEQLSSMKKRLKERKDKAGFFKDKTLYEQKMQRLDAYLYEVDTLKETTEAEPTLLALQARLEQDKVLNASTARFFKSSKNVTLTREIRALQNIFT